MAPYTYLTVARERGIERLTLNRPDVRNAFNEDLIGELAAWAGRAADDQALRLVVIAGAGPVFCAGADLAWMAKMAGFSREDNLRDATAAAHMFAALNSLRVPLIARVHGAALGGGAGLAAVCDVVVAEEHAVFGFTEVKLGIIPAVIAPYALAKIGESNARELFLTGGRFSAARAREIGLVHAVVPAAELDRAVDGFADEFLTAGPEAIAAAKALIARLAAPLGEDVRALTAEAIADRRASAEGQEGLRAFLESGHLDGRDGSVAFDLTSLRGARVRVVEVGPRDGLQNEAALISTADKIALVNGLAAAGHTAIEASAFVSPKWVPQMADAEQVLAGIERRPGVRYSALVPNLAGLARARTARVDEVAIFAAASETFSQRNINQTIGESLDTYRAVCKEARAAELRVRGYLSTAFGCPFEGSVAPAKVAEVTARLLELGAYEVAVSDTIGIAHPAQVVDVLTVVTRGTPIENIALHFHDTRGTALANVLAGLQAGVRTFDASVGGLGGCPYAPGASGNLATEDLIYLLDGLGIETGIRLEGLLTVSRAVEPLVGHPLPSRVFQASQRTRR